MLLHVFSAIVADGRQVLPSVAPARCAKAANERLQNKLKELRAESEERTLVRAAQGAVHIIPSSYSPTKLIVQSG